MNQATPALLRESRGDDMPGEWPSDAARQAEMAAQHYQFIWRSLRRLGVGEHAVDDAAQQVFVLAATKMAHIVPGSERAFLFQTALRTAMSVRRDYAQRREDALGEESDELVDPAPLPDANADRAQRRAHLDDVLNALAMELRTVFVLYEIEGLDSIEIADLLEIPVGTVASRLRRAREAFRAAAERMRLRMERRARR